MGERIRGIHYGVADNDTAALVKQACKTCRDARALSQYFGISRPYAKWLFKRYCKLPGSWTPTVASVEIPEGSQPTEPDKRARDLYKRFQALQSVRLVAEEAGLSRQRVYQLLRRGVSCGLFPSPFTTKHAPSPTQSQTFIDMVSSATSLHNLKRRLEATSEQLSNLIDAHQMTMNTLQARLKHNKAFRQRDALLRNLRPYVLPNGALPSTTELQKTASGRNLYYRLIRHFGSYTMVRGAARRHYS